jgi:RHS repeat-associated protein
MQLHDLRGNTVTTIDLTTNTATGWCSYDEFGNQDSTNPANTNLINYNTYAGAERATNATGLILMGARVYNPETNQFTSPDPIQGGNENNYTYPNDPMGRSDFTGCSDVPSWWFIIRSIWRVVASAVEIIFIKGRNPVLSRSLERFEFDALEKILLSWYRLLPKYELSQGGKGSYSRKGYLDKGRNRIGIRRPVLKNSGPSKGLVEGNVDYIKDGDAHQKVHIRISEPFELQLDIATGAGGIDRALTR